MKPHMKPWKLLTLEPPNASHVSNFNLKVVYLCRYFVLDLLYINLKVIALPVVFVDIQQIFVIFCLPFFIFHFA
jgi:hypothetical protein